MKAKSVDDFVARYTPKERGIINSLRSLVKEELPEANEVLSYGVPGFKLNGKNLILFAVFKNHVGIYPDPRTIEAFKSELGKYELSKGTVRFPLDEPLPMKLISRMIKYRAKGL